MFRMTPHGHRLSNGGLTDSHLPLDVPGGSPHLGYLPRDPPGTYPHTRVKRPKAQYKAGGMNPQPAAALAETLGTPVDVLKLMPRLRSLICFGN